MTESTMDPQPGQRVRVTESAPSCPEWVAGSEGTYLAQETGASVDLPHYVEFLSPRTGRAIRFYVAAVEEAPAAYEQAAARVRAYLAEHDRRVAAGTYPHNYPDPDVINSFYVDSGTVDLFFSDVRLLAGTGGEPR